MPTEITEDLAIQQLKEVILDENFTSLQNLVSEEINLMEILRVSRKELQHSNFLAWFFNPNESHNLGDYALKEFIKIYFKENQFENFGKESQLSVFDFVQLDFRDLEIRREYKNIDLIFFSRKNQFCIVIENKIYASEGEGQLKKYRQLIEEEYSDFKHKIYIFLSLEEQEISETEQDYYVQLNYDHIIKLIQQVICSKQLKLAEKTKFVFEQYLQTLKSMKNKNEEIEEIAKQLYKKYQSAFDLIFKYVTPSAEGVEGLVETVEIFNEKAKGEYLATGAAFGYRMIKIEGFPSGLHYEFLYRKEGITSDFHIENQRFALLSAELQAIAKEFPKINDSKVEFDAKWSAGKGRLKVLPKDKNPEFIAKTMIELIRITKDRIKKAIHKLENEDS